jgi:hypothetical protein
MSFKICLVIAALFGSAGLGFAYCLDLAKPERSKLSECSDELLCHWARGDQNWSADYDLQRHVNEAIRRGLSCGLKNAGLRRTSRLRKVFTSLAKDQRSQIQSNLKASGFYKSSIDGLYGAGTKKALEAYNKQHLSGSDLTKKVNVERLLLSLFSATPPLETFSPKD